MWYTNHHSTQHRSAISGSAVSFNGQPLVELVLSLLDSAFAGVFKTGVEENNDT